MVVSAEEQARQRQKAEARRQRILAKSAERLDVVSSGMASKEVANSTPTTTASNNAAARRRRQQKKKNEGGNKLATAKEMQTKKTVEKLCLTLRANTLTNVAGIFKEISDPYAEVYLTDGSDEKQLLGTTEVIKNSLHPAWTESFLFDYCDGGKITVKIIDKVPPKRSDDKDTKSRDIYMGSAEFRIGDILLSGGNVKEEGLENDENEQCGKVWAHITKVPPRSAGKLVLRLKGSNLKDDPYFEIRRTYDQEVFEGTIGKRLWPVYRSKYMEDNPNQNFEAASIDINDLCNGYLDRTIQVIVYDHEDKGRHNEIGSFDTTVNNLLNGVGESFELKADSKKILSVVECKIVGADPAPPPSTIEDTLSKDGEKSASTSSTNKAAIVNFLSTFEEMIKQQDFEYDRTTKHLRNVFDRIQHLGRNSSNVGAPQDGRGYEGMLTYCQMRRCLLRVGITWNRSLPPFYDDDISVNSVNTLISAKSGNPFINVGGKRELITTDAQLVMLLTTLVEAEESYRAEKIANNDEDGTGGLGICFPEFVQCYQLIVAAMQTLQLLNMEDDIIGRSQIVDRVKERTFGLLRPFGPDTALYKKSNEAASSARGNDGLLPGSKRKEKREGNDEGGLDENEVKNIVQSKDSNIVKLIQDHENEMDDLAERIALIQAKFDHNRKMIKLWRVLLLVAVAILSVGSLGMFITREQQRQVEVAEGIAALRGADKKLNADMIAKLSEQREVLGKKARDTEGTMRYLVTRNEGIDASTEELEAKIERVDLKYRDKVDEHQRCEVQKQEFEKAMRDESTEMVKLEEELGWCQGRSEEDESGMTGGKGLRLYMKYNKLVRHAVTIRQTYAAAAGLIVSTIVHKLVPLAVKYFAPKPVQIVTKPWYVYPWWRGNKLAELTVVDRFFGGTIFYLVVRAIAVFILP